MVFVYISTDLIVTIEQLHKTKLSEHSNKTLGSEANSSCSQTSSRLHPDSASHPLSWTSRLESFSKQLRQFQAVPETPKVQTPGNVIADKTVNAGTAASNKNKHASTRASLTIREDLEKKSKALDRATKKSRTISSRADSRKVEVTDALSNDYRVKHLELNSVDEDFDISVISDVLVEQDSVILDKTMPTSSLVLDEHSVIEDGLENSEAHYDIVGNREILPEPVDTGTSTRKKSKKQKKPEEMLTDSKTVRSKGTPVWSQEDLKKPESLKIVLDRVASLLRPDKKVMIAQAKELEVEAKEAMYLEELSSYVDLCIQTNMVRKRE